jgi:hypothetical protein
MEANGMLFKIPSIFLSEGRTESHAVFMLKKGGMDVDTSTSAGCPPPLKSRLEGRGACGAWTGAKRPDDMHRL